jgi:hypothetical protein
MRRYLVLIGLVVGACVGCTNSDPGDVATAQKASARAPKSAADLPSSMPKEAQASATAAMGQAQAVQSQGSDPVRLHALEMMRQQKHH